MNLIQQFPQAQTFTFQGQKEAILMIHGFTSTPQIFRDLGSELSKKFGYEIDVPLLPGHGLGFRDLDTVTHDQWIAFCEQKFLSLSSRFSKIHLIGISMGGTLCAHLATKFPDQTESLILLSPAMYLKDKGSRLLLSFLHWIPKKILEKWVLRKEDFNVNLHNAYDRYSAASVIEFDSVCKVVKNEFQTDKPCLIFSPINDETIDPKSSQWFLQHSSNPSSKVIKLSQSPHVVFLGKENEKIFKDIESFLKKI